MSNFKIQFRDQTTGRQMEVDAEKIESGWGTSAAEQSMESTSADDGQVDIMVNEKRWMFNYGSHLGVKTDGLSSEEATALKRALEDPRSANVRVFDVLSGRQMSGLSILRTDAAGELTQLSDNLDPTGARRPVQLTPSGHIATPSGGEPGSPKEIGDGLFRAASLIDDVKGNLFDEIQAPLALKEKMFTNLVESMESVAPGQPLPEGMDATQGLQMRSSAATTMLELMTSKHQINNDLKTRAFDFYENAIQQETNPLLKDSMLLNLDRLRANLPSALRDRIDELKAATNVGQPPYDKWFANGDNTVKVDWSVGAGEGFLEDNVAHLKSKGFEIVEEQGGHPVMEKTYDRDGVETKIQIHFRTIRTDMFDALDDEDTDITIYSGHSNWGRNVRDSLKRAPEASGDGKLVMTNLCVGKGELQQMRDAFPDADMITTYNSGYFRPGNDAEWHYAVDALFEGIANRDGYESIADDTRDRNPWTRTHRWNEGIDNNYIYPTDLKTRREVLDQDHDGQADVFDRMVNFNSFDVQTDTAREFQAIDPGRDTDSLVGTKIHFAAMSTNRISIYNELLEERNGDAEVIPAGYHDRAEGEQGLFRFERQDGRLAMSMDAQYAHMSEEALRMASAFEYSMFKSDDANDWPYQNKTDNLLAAMVLASQSLNSDAGYRDNAVWSEFIEAYNLPDISLSQVASARGADSHFYSGSKASVTSLKSKLSPEILERLAAPEVGVFQ